MRLEDQVCSLELAERLKELGVKQESLFYWEKCPDHGNNFVISCNEHHNQITGEWSNCHILEDQENYCAFTVSELGEMLPDNVYTQKDCAELKTTWFCHGQREVWIANTEADSRAKMLIYLIEKGLMPE